MTGLLVLGSLLALGVGYLGAMRSRRVRPAFVGGSGFDREIHRFPGTEFYRDGAGDARARTRRSPPESPAGSTSTRCSAAAGAPVVDLLRRLHTGLLQDYVAWCLLGRRRGARLPALELTLDAILIGLAAFLVLGSVAALEMKNLLSAVITVGRRRDGALHPVPPARRARHRDHPGRGRGDRGDRDDPRHDAHRGRGERGGPARSPRSSPASARCWSSSGSGWPPSPRCPPFGAPRPERRRTGTSRKRSRATGAGNVVTSIVLDFRGYDTLGEATVILVAVAGALVDRAPRRGRRRVGATPAGRRRAAGRPTPSEEAPHA